MPYREPLTVPAWGAHIPIPRFSVIVVTWNTRDLTLRCVEHLKRCIAEAYAEIIVVDNGSTDDTVGTLRTLHPDVVVLENDANLGYARGANLGLRRATETYVVFINSDAIPLGGSVTGLVSFLAANRSIGAVGGYHQDGVGRYMPTGRAFPALRHDILKATGLEWIGYWFLHHGVGLWKLWFPSATCDVDCVSGSFLAIRREILSSAGPLPEEFFVYGEDVEWCWRIKNSGWRIAFLHGDPVIHDEGQTAHTLFGIEKDFYILDGLHAFAQRHRNPLSWRTGWLLRALFFASIGLRWRLRGSLTGHDLAHCRADYFARYARHHVAHVVGRSWSPALREAPR